MEVTQCLLTCCPSLAKAVPPVPPGEDFSSVLTGLWLSGGGPEASGPALPGKEEEKKATEGFCWLSGGGPEGSGPALPGKEEDKKAAEGFCQEPPVVWSAAPEVAVPAKPEESAPYIARQPVQAGCSAADGKPAQKEEKCPDTAEPTDREAASGGETGTIKGKAELSAGKGQFLPPQANARAVAVTGKIQPQQQPDDPRSQTPTQVAVNGAGSSEERLRPKLQNMATPAEAGNDRFPPKATATDADKHDRLMAAGRPAAVETGRIVPEDGLVHKNYLVPGKSVFNRVMTPLLEAIQVRRGPAGDEDVIRVRLKPATLGEVAIEMVRQEGKVTGRVTVENILVREVIEANLSRLREKLAEQGVELAGLDVSLGDSAGRWREQRGFGFRQEAGIFLPAAATLPAAVLETGLVAAGRLDVRA